MRHPPASPDHVVAIGASAGGLEALQDLTSHLQPGGNVAYVVAQHLAPDHPSQLVDLLARSTQLKVMGAKNGSRLEPGQLLVIPPNSDATVDASNLQLKDPEPRFGPSPSIDLLFESLATHWGERAVAVVLSGTGSDGALGLRAIGAVGGLALVQSPESARFDGMPRAAIALGGSDLVADAATLGIRISRWFNHQGDWNGNASSSSEPLLLSSAAALLRHSTGIDFSQYKESTLRRQIQRRLAMCDISNMEDYLPLLASDASEAQALAQNLLVTVTTFFRDPNAFAALAESLKPLIARRHRDEKLRIWVPGCATGEEAFSIGMTISQAMGHPANLSQQLKIFATDLDEQSLAFGRRGIYPASEAKAIPSDLLHRFTIQGKGTLQINKDLRSCIIFARHNVTEDPPFPSIDIISCRNTLIYFTAPLQEQVLDLFSFSLLPGGLLFLGSSESLGRACGFKAVNGVHRIYERTHEGRSRSKMALTMPVHRGSLSSRVPKDLTLARETVPEQHVILLEALLRALSHPSLVLDEKHDLVEVIGDVSSYCRIPEGQMTASAGAFLRDELQSEARALFLLVRADGKAACSRNIQLEATDTELRLEAAPLRVGERTLTILSFIKTDEDHVSRASDLGCGDRDAAFAREIERLERELLSSQDTLRRSMADLEKVNEELEASSEELQASSEELQSSNEELQASIEELQATNEELGTLNQQLRIRSNQLEHLNVDLENIQSSLSQGMVIVDSHLRINRFSPLAVRLFGLVDSDIGQPLITVPTTIPLPTLHDALLAVISGEERHSIEASSEEVSYLVQVMPYRNREGQCLGAIITLTDVSEQVALRRVAEAALREFASLADGLDQAVWKRDHTMRQILYMSRQIEMLTGWTPAELVQNSDLFDGAILAADRPAVAAARHAGGSGWSVTYQLIGRDGHERTLKEVGTIVEESDDQYIVGTLSDVTKERLFEKNTRLLAAGYTELVSTQGAAVALLNESLTIVSAGTGFSTLLGQQSDGLKGQSLYDLMGLLEHMPDSGGSQQDPTSIAELALSLLRSDQSECTHHTQVRLTRPPFQSLQLTMIPLFALDRVEGLLLLLEPPTAD